MKEANSARKETIVLFIIPALCILLGLSSIGWASNIKHIQDKLEANNWDIVSCNVVAKGVSINPEYDFGVQIEDITDSMYHISYNNYRGKRIDCLYDCKIQTMKVPSKRDFFVNPDDEHDVILVQSNWVITLFTCIGAFMILLGFILCAKGLRIVSTKLDSLE